MPRNGSGVYSLPAGSIVANGETIDVSQHNPPLQDIASDLNTARPISAGGTGAATATAALINLGFTATAAELNALDGVTTAGTNMIRAANAAVQKDALGLGDLVVKPTLQDLKDDTDLTYTTGNLGTVVAGDIITTLNRGFSYSVAASAATDHDIVTAGGVKCYANPTQRDIINVKAYGAKGDGVTDDTAAIQAAINEVRFATDFNGHIEIPRGAYVISAPLNITTGRAPNISGAGSNCTLIFAKAGSFTSQQPLIDIKRSDSGSGYRVDNLNWSGFRLQDLAAQSVHGIDMTWLHNSKLSDIAFYNLRIGLLCSGFVFSNTFTSLKGASMPAGSRGVVLAGADCNQNTFVGCSTPGGDIGLQVLGGAANLNLIGHNAEGGTGAKISITPETGHKVTNLVINGGYVENPNTDGSHAIVINGADGDSVEGFIIEGFYANVQPSSPNGTWAIVARNCNRGIIQANKAVRYSAGFLNVDSTARNLRVVANSYSSSMALTNLNDSLHPAAGGYVSQNQTGRTDANGQGSPQGVLAAAVGSIYTDVDTGTVYRKISGGSGNTGWVTP